MNDYIQVDFNFTPVNETEADILSAFLCDINFESFVPNDKGISSFIKKEFFNSNELELILQTYPFTSKITWTENLIIGKDWNEEWEKNYFKPMVIAGRCVIHSSFHTDYPKMEFDVTIDPKMAFGTGHHSTTNLIVSELLSESLSGFDVLDMGTGTGILSIISVMNGARSATGIEIDEAAYVNALENIKLNEVDASVNILHGDASLISNLGKQDYDIILANINRNVILNDIGKYASVLKKGGRMLLSGFYYDEIGMIETKADEYSLKLLYTKEDNNWAMIVFEKI